MFDPDIPSILLIVAGAFGAALIAVIALRNPMGRQNPHPRALIAGDEARVVFLFDDQAITDMTESARSLFSCFPKRSTDWRTFCSAFEKAFPTLEHDLSTLAFDGSARITSAEQDDKTTIAAEWWEGVTRIEILDTDASNVSTASSSLAYKAMQGELDLLRHAVSQAPLAIWQAAEDGSILWANRQYLEVSGSSNSWPPVATFSDLEPHPLETVSAPKRLKNAADDAWYDIQTSAFGPTQVGFAVSADAEVSAESARKNFIQTLSKTFAHLSVGLVIFNQDRQLVLFNPALTDLLSLPVDFLSSRPTLFSFLDRLRDLRLIPEPKNYQSWRSQIAEVESAASDGSYQENWSLPDGRTYRVTGRPHPNGAIAFQIEDISPEIALTRSFRSELDLNQSVLDALAYGIAVFSTDGILSLSNAAYAEIWGVDPATTLGEISAGEALEHWKLATNGHPFWDDVDRYLFHGRGDEPISELLTMRDRTRLAVKVQNLPGGAHLVSFRPNASDVRAGQDRPVSTAESA